ncbi:MAG TPA: stage II sporulation protein P [Candidatus Merdenecus merdavium]|nr:stage II sporulation protein P [Candidatus Merdenecus merdavium]
MDVMKNTSTEVRTYSAIQYIGKNLDQMAVKTYMPSFLYPLQENEQTSSLEAFVVDRLFETVPLYKFVKLNSSYETDIEDEATYERILMAEHGEDSVMTSSGESTTAEAQETQLNQETSDTTEGETLPETQQEEQASAVPIAPIKDIGDITLEKLNDFDYLLNNFYTVDKMTTINSSQLNIESLMGNDLSITKDPSVPQILIYHTHSQEEFIDSIPGDPSTSIVGVGDYLTSLLRDQYGYNVIHHTGVYDLVDGVLDRDYAYTLAGEGAAQILREHPSIEVVIDLHRDGFENKKFVTDINGKPTARVMLFNGLSRTTSNGDISYLPNPYISENLSFSFQLQLKAAQNYPGLMRNIYLRGLRYNLHLKPRTLLIESGTQLNTVQEQKNAMEPLAEMLNQILSGT